MAPGLLFTGREAMMKNRSNAPGRAGFTLVELLVVLAVLVIALLVAVPALQNLILGNRLEGASREVAGTIQLARLEAVKRSVPVIVRIDPSTKEVFAFADVNGPTMADAPDGVFNPVAGQPRGGTDYRIARRVLDETVSLQAPGGQPAIDGFTMIGGERVALLTATGAVDQVGAFRLADPRGNFLEVRVEPQATARISVRKWDGSNWWVRGEGGAPWHWD